MSQLCWSCRWHLAGGGQGCSETSPRAQDAPRLSPRAPDVGGAALENPAFSVFVILIPTPRQPVRQARSRAKATRGSAGLWAHGLAADGLTGPRGFGNGGRSRRDETPATQPSSQTSSRQAELTRCPLCPRDSWRAGRGTATFALAGRNKGSPCSPPPTASIVPELSQAACTFLS